MPLPKNSKTRPAKQSASETVSDTPVYRLLEGDNLACLDEVEDESVSLIYIDPPFNTGKTQRRQRMKVSQSDNGTRKGFGDKTYHAEAVTNSPEYTDSFSDFMGFLEPRLKKAYRKLTANGSMFFHIDWRESARCRLLLEKIFGGAEYCINEIIWAYDFGARAKTKWPAKHDNIYWFAKNPDNYIYNYDAVDRFPYMTPDLVGTEKAGNGKTPTDVWWQTIVPTNGYEKTGYPTQKPLAILERIIKMHSNPGDVVLDFFAGSGTTGEAAAKNGRGFILAEKNPQAIRVIKNRLAQWTEEAQQKRPYQLLNNIAKYQWVEEAQQKRPYHQLLDIAESMNGKYSSKINKQAWINSPFEWMINLPSGTKGSIGRKLMWQLLEKRGFAVNKRKSKDYDMLINGYRVAIKSSFLWDTKKYKFQQLRNQDYDFLICVGISPHAVHAWVALKPSIDWENLNYQHGKSGKDQWTDSFSPATNPYSWMLPQDGNLQKAVQHLRALTTKPVVK